MRTDGLRVVVVSTIGIAAVAIGAVSLIGPPTHRDLPPTIVLCGGGAALVWAATGNRPVGRIGWLATALVATVAFVRSLLTSHSDSPLPTAVLNAIFWWFAAVLVVVPVAQAVNALRHANRIADNAPGGPSTGGNPRP